jgi:hypothetical protein
MSLWFILELVSLPFWLLLAAYGFSAARTFKANHWPPERDLYKYVWALLVGQPLLWKKRKEGVYEFPSAKIVVRRFGIQTMTPGRDIAFLVVDDVAYGVTSYWHQRILKALDEHDRLMTIYNINKSHPRVGSIDYAKNQVKDDNRYEGMDGIR